MTLVENQNGQVKVGDAAFNAASHGMDDLIEA
jgi:hypothetical protein